MPGMIDNGMIDNRMIDNGALADCLSSMGLDDWPAALDNILQARFSKHTHGDFERWQRIVGAVADAAADTDKLRELLLGLSPWRKGPFRIADIEIDAEWRSDIKWARVVGAIEPLHGRRVLGVGGGNGYYALEMQKAGADAVIGIDPTLLYVMQFLAVNIFERQDRVFVLPLRLKELPPARKAFDTVFSMGVLYHQRAPVDHLRALRSALRPGGQLVLETIFIPGAESYACTPAERYARMRNVWLLPTLAELTTGYRDIDIVDSSVTTTDEQRTTAWMPFESLAEALDPDDNTRTVEGWPAPRRVVVTAVGP